jgi:hypothetical protein
MQPQIGRIRSLYQIGRIPRQKCARLARSWPVLGSVLDLARAILTAVDQTSPLLVNNLHPPSCFEGWEVNSQTGQVKPSPFTAQHGLGLAKSCCLLFSMLTGTSEAFQYHCRAAHTSIASVQFQRLNTTLFQGFITRVTLALLSKTAAAAAALGHCLISVCCC